MQNTLDGMFAEFRRSWQFRWIGLTIAWIVAIGAAVTILTLPDLYSSNAQLFFRDDQGEEVVRMVTNVQTSLMSDENIAKLAEAARNEDSSSLSTAESVALIRSGLTLEGVGTESLSIKYIDTVPERTSRVVTALIDLLDSLIRENAQQVIEGDFKVIRGQLTEVEARLRTLDVEIFEFRRENLDVLGRGGIEARVEAAKIERDDAEAAYLAAIKLRDQMKSDYDNGRPTRQVLPSEEPQADGDDNSAVGRLDTLYTELNELKTQYSERHPDVMAVRREIQGIVNQFPSDNRECFGEAEGLGVSSLAPNAKGNGTTGVKEELMMRLVKAKVAVCVAEDDMNRTQLAYEQLDAIAAGSFPIQEKLSNMTSEKTILETRRDEMRQRISNFDNANFDNIFVVMEKPEMPKEPDGPNRQLLLFATLLAAPGIGALAAYGRSLITETFVHPSEVEATFGLPVFGDVSLIKGMLGRVDSSFKNYMFNSALFLLLFFLVGLALAEQFIGDTQTWLPVLLRDAASAYL